LSAKAGDSHHNKNDHHNRWRERIRGRRFQLVAGIDLNYYCSTAHCAFSKWKLAGVEQLNRSRLGDSTEARAIGMPEHDEAVVANSLQWKDDLD
jgi:hypothetical protein